ncbi:YadA-like family protein [Pseudescherichia sp.]|uniref:YadA-like family protein n=1 Tax=Pseudescherichia sp. TaxID=2055881 RepID=UPI0028AF1782|nr:YadA-like family protein [Pseudescherichia sp.]
MKKSILSLVIATAIASIATNSFAALITTTLKGDNGNGSIAFTGYDGATYNMDNIAQTVITAAINSAAAVNSTDFTSDQLRQDTALANMQTTFDTDQTRQDTAIHGLSNDMGLLHQDVDNNILALKSQDNRIAALENAPTPANGVDGKDGAPGINGKDGVDGKDGAPGINGKDGVDGKDGAAGINGKDGVNGKDGAAGINGKDGENGKDGATGAAGVNGKAGVDGHDGKDADMSKVNANTAAIQTNVAGIQSNAQRADDLDIRIKASKAAQDKANATLAQHTAQLADHETRISDLEQSNSATFGKLKNEVDENRKRASAGIAGVAAMANIPQVLQNQSINVGAGVGTTDGETALAVGFSGRAGDSTVVKASVSNDTQHNFVVGAGVAVGW